MMKLYESHQAHAELVRAPIPVGDESHSEARFAEITSTSQSICQTKEREIGGF